MNGRALAHIAGGLMLVACGGPPRAASFVGRSERPTVSDDAVREVDAVPSGYDVLGRVFSECTATSGVRAIERAWLKDVACSEGLLVGALRARAASAGGELLVGRHCSDRVDEKNGVEHRRLRCVARVARPDDGAPAGRGLGAPFVPGAAMADDLPSGAIPVEAWRIAVTVTPSPPERAPRRARDPDLVGQLPVLPVNQVPFGGIVARCEGTCSEGTVRYAVRAAAARIGADGVSGIRCVQGRPGWICTGEASVHGKHEALWGFLPP